MKKVIYIAAALVVAIAALITTNPAVAASKKHKQKQPSSVGAIRAACLRQVGAQYRGNGRWQMQGGLGTGQQQAFYNCLDAHTMNKR
jgi:hypothetical protein